MDTSQKEVWPNSGRRWRRHAPVPIGDCERKKRASFPGVPSGLQDVQVCQVCTLGDHFSRHPITLYTHGSTGSMPPALTQRRDNAASIYGTVAGISSPGPVCFLLPLSVLADHFPSHTTQHETVTGQDFECRCQEETSFLEGPIHTIVPWCHCCGVGDSRR